MEWYCGPDMKQQIDAARTARDMGLLVATDQTLSRAKATFSDVWQRVQTWANARSRRSAQWASSS